MPNLIISMDAEGWYSFVNRGVQYDLKEEKQWGHWVVFTWRQSLPKKSRSIRAITLEEMEAGSNRTLKTFADFVSAEPENLLT